MADADSNPSHETVARAVLQDDPPPPTPKEVIAAVAHQLGVVTVRLRHVGRVAWTVARSVGTTTDSDRAIVRQELAAWRNDRKRVKQIMAEAANALVEIRAACEAADAIRTRGETLLWEHRQRLDDVRTAATVDAADAALALTEDIRRLDGPLGDVASALEDARLRNQVIEASLQRRIHSTCVVAIESQVDAITAQLRALKAEVDRIHSAENQPDPIVTACLAAMDLLQVPALPLPTVTWPKWSSVGSKHPKGAWVGDLFAVPEVKEPESA